MLPRQPRQLVEAEAKTGIPQSHTGRTLRFQVVVEGRNTQQLGTGRFGSAIGLLPNCRIIKVRPVVVHRACTLDGKRAVGCRSEILCAVPRFRLFIQITTSHQQWISQQRHTAIQISGAHEITYFRRGRTACAIRNQNSIIRFRLIQVHRQRSATGQKRRLAKIGCAVRVFLQNLRADRELNQIVQSAVRIVGGDVQIAAAITERSQRICTTFIRRKRKRISHGAMFQVRANQSRQRSCFLIRTGNCPLYSHAGRCDRKNGCKQRHHQQHQGHCDQHFHQRKTTAGSALGTCPKHCCCLLQGISCHHQVTLLQRFRQWQ